MLRMTAITPAGCNEMLRIFAFPLFFHNGASFLGRSEPFQTDLGWMEGGSYTCSNCNKIPIPGENPPNLKMF